MFKKQFLTAFLLILILVSAFGCSQKPGQNPAGDPASGASASPGASKVLPDNLKEKVEKLEKEAKTLMEEKKYQEAIKIFDEILAIDDSYAKALLGKGEALAAMKKWDEAKTVLDKLIEVDPDNMNGLLLRSEVYLELGNTDQYLKDRRRAAQKSPFTFRSNYELGRALGEAKRYEEAISTLNKALGMAESKQEKKSVYVALATVYIQKSSVVEAEKFVGEALKIDPEDSQCQLLMMIVYNQKDQKDKAMEAYEKYKKLDPNEKLINERGPRMKAQIMNILGNVHLARGEMDEALKNYDEAAKNDPQKQLYHLNGVMILAQQGKPKEAKERARKWVDLKPDQPASAEEYADHAIAYAMLERNEEAFKYINMAIKKEPDENYLYATRALLFYYAGDKKEFQRDFDKFMTRASDDEKKYVMGLFEKVKKNYKELQ